MNKSNFDYTCDFLKRRSGLILDESKAYLLETRMFPVLKKHKLDSLDALAVEIKRNENGSLAMDAIHAMTTNETLFFRDKYPFDALREVIFPELEKSGSAFSRINIWSAACSRGQEPYSIAMTGLQSMKNVTRRMRITASDLDRDILTFAAAAKYSQMEVQRGLGVQQLVRFFEQHGESWCVREELRNLVSFHYANLVSDSLARDLRATEPFHIVFCRNVMIYFSPEARTHVIDRIAGNMVLGGYLITGAAETVRGARSTWESVQFANRRLWKLKSK